MTTTMHYGAAILVGGHSHRMGRDKAGLPHPRSGETLLRRQLNLLTGLTLAPSHRWVSCRRDQVPTLVLPDGVSPVLDDGTSGPLGGLVACARAAATGGATHLLVLAVDLPEMDTTTLQQLVDACDLERGAVARTSSGWEPLAAVYPATVFDALEQALREKRLSLQQLFTNEAFCTRFAQIRPKDDRVFTNWNHPKYPA